MMAVVQTVVSAAATSGQGIPRTSNSLRRIVSIGLKPSRRIADVLWGRR